MYSIHFESILNYSVRMVLFWNFCGQKTDHLILNESKWMLGLGVNELCAEKRTAFY